MATASADCPSGQCMANDGSCMDNDCTPEAERGDWYCQYYWGSTSTCSNGECVNSCTNPESVLPTHSTQYTCAEVATGYTTNCGTCGDTNPNAESGLEKPAATLNEVQKMVKVIQWLCVNRRFITSSTNPWTRILSGPRPVLYHCDNILQVTNQNELYDDAYLFFNWDNQITVDIIENIGSDVPGAYQSLLNMGYTPLDF